MIFHNQSSYLVVLVHYLSFATGLQCESIKEAAQTIVYLYTSLNSLKKGLTVITCSCDVKGSTPAQSSSPAVLLELLFIGSSECTRLHMGSSSSSLTMEGVMHVLILPLFCTPASDQPLHASRNLQILPLCESSGSFCGIPSCSFTSSLSDRIDPRHAKCFTTQIYHPLSNTSCSSSLNSACFLPEEIWQWEQKHR